MNELLEEVFGDCHMEKLIEDYYTAKKLVLKYFELDSLTNFDDMRDYYWSLDGVYSVSCDECKEDVFILLPYRIINEDVNRGKDFTAVCVYETPDCECESYYIFDNSKEIPFIEIKNDDEKEEDDE